MKKKVRHLAVGDVLDSGSIVVKAPYDSVRCPKDHTNLIIKQTDDKKYGRVWRKETLVEVIGKAGVDQRIKTFLVKEYPHKEVDDEIYLDFNHSQFSGHATYKVLRRTEMHLWCVELENTGRELTIEDVI